MDKEYIGGERQRHKSGREDMGWKDKGLGDEGDLDTRERVCQKKVFVTIWVKDCLSNETPV
jgi:hypothetical protein